MTEAELAKFAGLWRNEKTHMPLQTEVRKGSLFAVGGGPLQPVAGNKFIARGGSIKLEFEIDSSSNPVAASLTQGNNKFRFLAETQWEPTANELNEFAGEWYSEESGAKVKILVKGLNLLITQRPDTKIPFMPKYKDHFTAGGGRQPVMWCSRDANGKISTLHLGAPRMRNMPFVRINK
ncbi:MAG: hypothetical protein HKN33_02515 [Pyrinomonadaceae bacterium]|nr:hypothetical protein [Pyrinomonadaceae bacterium]